MTHSKTMSSWTHSPPHKFNINVEKQDCIIQTVQVNETKDPCFVIYFQFTDHLQFDRTNVLKDLAPDTVYITSVRDPNVHTFFAFHYFYKQKAQRQDLQIEDILQLPLIKEGVKAVYVPHQHLTNKTTTEAFIKENLDKLFSFVVVTDYFDESLVMLKRKLCWDLKDIIYIPKNVNRKKKVNVLDATIAARIRRGKASNQSKYTLEYSLTFKFWAYLTFLLCVYHAQWQFCFVAWRQCNIPVLQSISVATNFWRSWRNRREVEFFQKVILKVKTYCEFIFKSYIVLKDVKAKIQSWFETNKTSLQIPKSQWNKDFVVTQYDCLLIGTQTGIFRLVLLLPTCLPLYFSLHWTEISLPLSLSLPLVSLPFVKNKHYITLFVAGDCGLSNNFQKCVHKEGEHQYKTSGHTEGQYIAGEIPIIIALRTCLCKWEWVCLMVPLCCSLKFPRSWNRSPGGILHDAKFTDWLPIECCFWHHWTLHNNKEEHKQTTSYVCSGCDSGLKHFRGRVVQTYVTKMNLRPQRAPMQGPVASLSWKILCWVFVSVHDSSVNSLGLWNCAFSWDENICLLAKHSHTKGQTHFNAVEQSLFCLLFPCRKCMLVVLQWCDCVVNKTGDTTFLKQEQLKHDESEFGALKFSQKQMQRKTGHKYQLSNPQYTWQWAS